jgi:spore germination protein YaaH
MTYYVSLRTACLAAVLCLAVSTVVAASVPSKADDPAFVVPKVSNPIPAEEIKDLQIVEDKGRWLVSDKALEQYGVYPANEKKGTYWFRLPPANDGNTLWNTKQVPLVLPGQAVKNGRTINIRYVRRPLGISYVLGEGQNELLPPAKATRTAPLLQNLDEPISESKDIFKGNTADEKVGLALFWDPVMDENADFHPIPAKKSVMSPCAFRLSTKGVELRDPDFAMLAGAYHEKGYAMWPLIDNNFDPQETHAVLQDTNLQDQMIKELVGYALLYQFKGYNIDFENVNYADKNALTAFVGKMSEAFHAYGLTVSMDVTPPSDSPNWSMVYDRKNLAPVLDHVMLMAYDQTGRTSPVAGPVAAYPWVEKAVQNTLELVPADKVVLGMPLYTRIWYESENGQQLPKDLNQWPAVVHTSSTQAAVSGTAGQGKKPTKLFVRTLTMADSEAIMKKYKEYTAWDDTLGLHYMDVPLIGGHVKIWFEEEQSLKKKIQLISQYHLGGASFWRKGFESQQFWQRFAKHELT